MTAIKVALLGFGTVGEGVYQAIQSHQKRLQDILGSQVEVAGILVKNPEKSRNVPNHVVITDDIERILEIPELEIVVEAIVGVEPGYSYLVKAIEKGKHVVTANKELMAHKGTELRKKAEANQVRIESEAAVAGSVPIIGTLRHLLQANEIVKIEAVLNGTSNFILTQMRENQLDFEKALMLAQENGYAEANPENDIDGWDAFYKLMILSDLLSGSQPDWNEVARQGIRGIRMEDIQAAEAAGFRLKQIASLTIAESSVQASVAVEAVPQEHLLYAVEGVDNAVGIEADLAGSLQLRGPGAGAKPTASAIMQDLVAIYNTNPKTATPPEVTVQNPQNETQNWLLIDKTQSVRTAGLIESWKTPSHEYITHVQADKKSIQSLLDSQTGIRAYRIAGNTITTRKTSLV